MKNVLGGVAQQPTTSCYNCTINYSGGKSVTGQSCGTDLNNASDNLTTNILTHASYGSPSSWSCADNAS